MKLGGPQSELLLRMMSAAALRGRVLASNITNQNTPGYRRREVRFEEQLVAELARSRPRLDRVRPEVVVDREAAQRADGNSVDMEREVSAARENRLLYELYASILDGRGRILRAAVREGR